MGLDGRVVALVGGDTPLVLGLTAGLVAAGGRVARLVPPTAGGRDEAGETVIQVALSERDAVFAALGEAVARCGPLAALVFAWYPDQATRDLGVVDMTDADIDAVWEQPMRSILFCFQAAYEQFKREGHGGRLVALVPTIAIAGGPGFAAAAAAAEGQRLLVKSAARQWGEDGVTANTLALAPAQVIPEAPNFEQSLAERALGRIGDPATDLAPVVAFLASGAGDFVTGTTLFVDGGLWMSAP